MVCYCESLCNSTADNIKLIEISHSVSIYTMEIGKHRIRAPSCAPTSLLCISAPLRGRPLTMTPSPDFAQKSPCLVTQALWAGRWLYFSAP